MINENGVGAPIICLCGSTRFKEKFMEWNKKFTLQGYIVLMPGVFGHSGDTITEKQKEKLDQLHKRKISMSDSIFVIDQDRYIGKSTKEEIEFAKAFGINVEYMSEKEQKENELWQ